MQPIFNTSILTRKRDKRAGMRTLYCLLLCVGLFILGVRLLEAAESAAVPVKKAVGPPSPPLVIEAPVTVKRGETNVLPEVNVDLASGTNKTSQVSTNMSLLSSTNRPDSETSVDLEAIKKTPLIQTNIVFNTKTNDIIFDLPLFDVIQALAMAEGTNVVFDAKLIEMAEGKTNANPIISRHFKGVSNQDVLSALLDNYHYELKSIPNSGIARVTMKDPGAPEPVYTETRQLQYASPTNIMSAVRSCLNTATNRSQVFADVRTSQLVIVATKDEIAAIDALIKKLDTPTRQILIEARLLETSQNPQSVKGIDWSGTLGNQRVAIGNGISAGTSSSTASGNTTTVLPSGRTVTGGDVSSSSYNTTMGSSSSGASSSTASSAAGAAVAPLGMTMNTAKGFAPNVAFLNADGVNAVLSFLNQDTDTEVVAMPRAVTQDNEPALLSVTRAYPIFEVTPGSASVAGGSSVKYTNLGTILTVTPRVSGSNNIALKIEPEVSNIDGKDTQVSGGQTYSQNIYAIRKIQTHVSIPSGHTLVMGGLISDTTTKSYTKVPILGDIPVVGLAFRQDAKKRLKQNLLIFITPTIIQEEDFINMPSSNFLQNKPKDTVDKKESAWDTGKPYEWGKSSKNSN